MFRERIIAILVACVLSASVSWSDLLDTQMGVVYKMAADPDPCSSVQFATKIAPEGTLTCTAARSRSAVIVIGGGSTEQRNSLTFAIPAFGKEHDDYYPTSDMSVLFTSATTSTFCASVGVSPSGVGSGWQFTLLKDSASFGSPGAITCTIGPGQRSCCDYSNTGSYSAEDTISTTMSKIGSPGSNTGGQTWTLKLLSACC